MDVVLVGLPGSGKSETARRLAARHGAALIDLDAGIEAAAGRTIAEIFAADGEAEFRRLEAEAVAQLPAPTRDPGIERVIASGGGAVIDPRNRWRLLRGRRTVWLDAPTSVLAARAAAAQGSRPLLRGTGPGPAIDRLRREREPWYAAAAARVDSSAALDEVVQQVELAARDEGGSRRAVLVRAGSPVGALVIGEQVAANVVDEELRRASARRAILVSEPVAWRVAGEAVAAHLRETGWEVELVELLPSGEGAKRLSVVEAVATQLTELGIERDEPIVAIGGGALTDAAGFAAATTLRGVPWLAVPTTLAGQLDAAIGGKTAVNLETGKNLVGAFHPPLATIVDVTYLGSLPERERRAALGEAAKVGVLGDERLLACLEADGAAIAAGDSDALESGALPEVVERAARFKLEVVTADPRERGDRIALNLGHTLGHALEAATGYGTLLHGEAVAYGLRLAARLAVRRGTASVPRADRIERLLDTLRLACDPLEVGLGDVLAPLAADKKRRHGRIRWVLPTDSGWTIDDRVPDDLVEELVPPVLGGRAAAPVPAPAR
jgi:shikimate kinase/3-dehydroquinate synthase